MISLATQHFPTFKMAEFAAHLNQGTTNENPTIFEIVAEESMATVLRPAVSYCLRTVLCKNQAKWEMKNFDLPSNVACN